MRRLIVTDLDKTLLRSDETISDYTAAVFRRARERGILVAFATARSLESSQPYRAVITQLPAVNKRNVFLSFFTAGSEFTKVLPVINLSK